MSGVAFVASLPWYRRFGLYVAEVVIATNNLAAAIARQPHGDLSHGLCPAIIPGTKWALRVCQRGFDEYVAMRRANGLR